MFSDIFHYEFLRNALMAGLLASVICGIIGSYIVVRRIVFISGGISHAAFGGIGFGYYMGFNPIWGAIMFSVASAILMGVSRRGFGQSEDVLIGILWAFGMALGILFISLTPGYTPDLMGYLFGNILTVPIGDIHVMAVLSLLIVLVVALFYTDIAAVSFDEEFASVMGRPVALIYYLMLVIVGLSVVVVIKIVGIILVISLLTIPAAIAVNYTRSLSAMIILSVILAMIFTVSGLYLSYRYDLQSGGTIILTAVLAYVLSLVNSFLLKKLEKRNA